MQVRLTHIGGPTVLIEFGGWRLLTDPTFDPAGGKYRFGWGTGSTKLTGPSISPEELGDVDAVLLSHDHHDDNLDAAGRALLPRAGTVITTEAGARRLGGNAVGLAPWGTTELRAEGKPPIEVTATPCRHGPPLSRPLVGEVIGFVLEWEGQRDGAVWITGDTVWFSGIRKVAERFDVGTAIVHLGGVGFPLTGPARFTMNAAEAVRVAGDFELKALVPIHYEGWKHFRQGREQVESTFRDAGLEDRVRWLRTGKPLTLEV